MKTLFLYSTLLVTFLWSASNTLAVGPKAEEWNDQDNNPAPARVIQAANKLWDAMEAVHAAENHFDSLERSIWDLFCEDFSPKKVLITLRRLYLGLPDPYHEERIKAQDVYFSHIWKTGLIWQEFRQTVKEYLAGRYWFGDLAEEDMYHELVPNQQWKVKLGIDNRDISSVLLGTLEFVNAWGGWAREFSPDSVRVLVRRPNSTQYEDIDDLENDDERLLRMMDLLDNLGYRWIDKPTSQPSGNIVSYHAPLVVSSKNKIKKFCDY